MTEDIEKQEEVQSTSEVDVQSTPDTSVQAETEPVADVTEPVAEVKEPIAEAEDPEAAAAEPVAEVVETEAEIEAPAADLPKTTSEIIERLRVIADSDDEVSRSEVESLKSLFYRLSKQQQEDELKAFVEGGGDADAWQPQPNPDEALFKEQMELVRQKRASQHEAEEQQKEENYVRKLAIIDKIKEILTQPDEVNRYYSEFKALQQEWNERKAVPAEKATDLWKNYQLVVEQYYDTLKLNNEFRAYDFKKNLELKNALCERAEKLADEPDPVVAFRQLQQLHQQFREIGPVERELRPAVWERFKAASTLINKRHQQHFEERKQQELENLEKKTALCEQIEAIDTTTLSTFADWNRVSDLIVALQQEWKTIGFAPQKQNTQIYERFRTACDEFFKQKSAFFRTVRDTLTTNLQLKQELVEQAEQLKDSTDWQATAKAVVALQRRWREIGAIPKKHSEELWQRFQAACDHFFQARKEAGADQRSEQQENLQRKQAIIDSLAAIDPETATEDFRPQLRQAQEDWNAIGHVPYRQKETLYQAFRAQMDRLYGALSKTATRRRVEQFRSRVSDSDGHVRERLLRQYDILNNEIKTYENNLGFLTLSSKSKSGNALVEELNRKVEKLHADLDEIRMKIAALDQKKKEESEPEAE